MAGHSKWANIKHRKEAVDAKRSNKFQKLIAEITKAAKNGNDPETNHVLKAAIHRAKAENMPKDVIFRALEKHKNQKNKQTYWVEARFAKQLSILIKVKTENLIRVLNDIKKIAQKTKMEILPGNSIRYLFERQYAFHLLPMTEDEVFNLIEGLEVSNLFLESEKTKIIFTNSESAKKFHHIIKEKNIKTSELHELFTALEKINLTPALVGEYNTVKEKLYEVEELERIFDNLHVQAS